MARFYRLALVKSSKVEFSPTTRGPGGAIFTPAEMRHNFAIWALKKDARQAVHLYYCVRCKQVFSVDDRSSSVTPLDPHGDPLHGSEAAKRLGTFSCGPCPAFGRLTAGPQLTSTVIPIRKARGRLTKLTWTGHRTWKMIVAQWHQFFVICGTQNSRSIRK
jgi:hypothetical protein